MESSKGQKSTFNLFNFSAILEALTGVGLIVVPALIIQFLIGGSLNEIGLALARVTGVALLALGVSGFELSDHPVKLLSRIGLLVYNLSVALLLMLFGLIDTINGLLLWPVAGLHFLVGILMVRALWSASAPR